MAEEIDRFATCRCDACQEIRRLRKVIEDLPAQLLHPDFGSEWHGPDGVIYKATKELRAENERLREELVAWQNRDPLSPDPERVQMLHAVRERDALKAENERLRKALDTVTQQ